MSGWLVVNHDIQQTGRTRQQLNSRGLACETAHDWRTAQQRLLSNHYDVVIVDEALPTEDGREVVHHLTGNLAGLTTKVVVTGNNVALAQRTSQPFLRCESTMLADIEQLIQQVS